jgi:hypothetical protein
VRYGLGVSAALSFLERRADEQWPFERFRGSKSISGESPIDCQSNALL